MHDGRGPNFPRLLNRVWALTDPASRSERINDALNALTPQQRFNTVRGAYWVCSQTGQLQRDAVVVEERAGKCDERKRQDLPTWKPSPEAIRECKKWLESMEPHRQTGRLFETGCGLGLFLRTAKEAGWRAEGNDISQVAAEHVMATSGVPVKVGMMEDVPLETGVYDVILCNNVFEHFTQPRAVIQKLAAALRPGGVMFFQTLSAQCLSLYFQPTGWLYYGEGHVVIPTLVTLPIYFRDAKLKVLRGETHGFRSAPTDQDYRVGRHKRKLFDKVMANIASTTGRGHRVKYLLQREG
jgi:2-polyprenyl-3-methyl-5-hydroxy-6-metoxy-1,4-benzoquinol methylase